MTPAGDTGPEIQKDLIKIMLDIIAKDTSIDRITSLVRINNDVHMCVRKGNETIKEFIERLKIPSFAYLNIVREDCHPRKPDTRNKSYHQCEAEVAVICE